MEQLIGQYGYFALFAGVFLEGETIVVAASFAAHQGYLKLPWVILVTFLGSLTGDQLYFFLGRLKGRAYLKSHPLWEPRVRRVQRLLERYRRLVMVGFRFWYGFRTVTPFALGISEVRTGQFIVFNVIGALAWSLTLGLLGFLFGAALETFLADVRRYERAALLVILLVGAGIWTAYRVGKGRFRRTPTGKMSGEKE